MKKIRNSFIVTRDTQNREIIMQKQAPIVEKKNKKNVVMHIKSMALVLVAALVISAFSAAIVHSLAKSGSGSGRSRDYAAKSVDMSKKDFASTEIFTAKGKKTDAGDWNCFKCPGKLCSGGSGFAIGFAYGSGVIVLRARAIRCCHTREGGLRLMLPGFCRFPWRHTVDGRIRRSFLQFCRCFRPDG